MRFPVSRFGRLSGPNRAAMVLTIAAHSALTALCGGCCEAALSKAARTEIALEDTRRELRSVQERLVNREGEVRELQARLARLEPEPVRKLRRELLVEPTEIRLDPHVTRGIDLDDSAGHDGVRVYVTIHDNLGDRIKQSGRLTVELFDLDAGGRRVENWSFDERATQSAWSSVLGEYGYKFDCRWNHGPPGNPKLTLRVKFVELLGGRTLTAEMPIELRLTGKSSPSVGDAKSP